MAKKLKKLLQTAEKAKSRPNHVNYAEYFAVVAPRTLENPNAYEVPSSALTQQSTDSPNEVVANSASSHAAMYSAERAKEAKVVVKEEKIPEKAVRPDHFDDDDSDTGGFLLDDECGTSKIIQIVKTKKRKSPTKSQVKKKRSRYQRQVSSSDSSDSSEDNDDFTKPIKQPYGYEEEVFSENYRFHYERLVVAPDADEDEQFVIDFDHLHLNNVEPSVQHDDSAPVYNLLPQVTTIKRKYVNDKDSSTVVSSTHFPDLLLLCHSLCFTFFHYSAINILNSP